MVGKRDTYLQQVHDFCSQVVAYFVRWNVKDSTRALLNKGVKLLLQNLREHCLLVRQMAFQEE